MSASAHDRTSGESHEARALAARALAHFQSGTTDQAEEQMRLPVDLYIDEARYAQEFDRIFKRLPQAVALSLELPEPGCYLAKRLLGVPLLVTRDQEGKVHAFLNVCRHRGAVVAAEGRGKRARFSCPYHSWTYDSQGALVGMYGAKSFGELDKGCHGLTALHCVERCGIIWACLTPGVTFAIDDWLGDFIGPLGALDLANWHLFEQRDIDGPGWKVTIDGYLEVYHHDTVHRKTVGQHTIGNLLVHDVFGPHQRLTFARRNVPELANLPQSEWDPMKYIRIIHSVFPNLSISGILGGQCLVSHVLPCETVDRTITRQSILCARKPETEEELATAQAFSAMTLEAVRDEDYVINFSVQSAIKSGANREFILGRNEPGVQHFHRTVARFMSEEQGRTSL